MALPIALAPATLPPLAAFQGRQQCGCPGRTREQYVGRLGFEPRTKGAEAIGKTIAERSIEKGIKRVVFDRSGFLYHGRIRAVADAARKAGLEF